MMGSNAAILSAAERHLGLAEWPGAKHNPEILAMYATAGHGWVKDDETPWCAAFVAAVLAECGLSHTGRLNARSYLDWGARVSLKDAMPGDVVVFWRGSPDAATGHVAFLVRFDGDRCVVRGGNQGNKVSDAGYPVSRIVGIRRAVGLDATKDRPVLQVGDRGAFVMDLQVRLRDLGYHLGSIDGHFGPATRAAVLALQADNGLPSDGIVGAMTWAALNEAQPKGERAVSADDLRKRGSETVALADKGEKVAQHTQTAAVALPSVGVVLEGARTLASAESALQAAQGVLLTYWPVLLLAGGVWVAATYGKRIFAALRDRRVEDARTGAHMGR